MSSPEEVPAPEVHALTKALVQGWNIRTHPAAGLTSQHVHDALVERVRFLLRHDFERLTNMLYLLDVPELRFRDAMAAEGMDGKAQALADAIWARELEKLHSRRRYKHDHSIETIFEPRGEE